MKASLSAAGISFAALILGMTAPSGAQAAAEAGQTPAPASGDAAAASDTTAANGGHELEEIIVTARKREESLVRVPAAVSVLTTTDLERDHVTDLSKISELTPDLVIQRAPTGNGAVLSIRGIGSSYEDAGIEQTVAINIDDVEIGRGRIAAVDQFDLKQVEVLKGPQALFFGKNSPAGVVSVSSADPTDHLSGYVRSGYEFYANEKYFEGAVSGPLTDTLSARIAGRLDDTLGWIVNDAQPTANPFVPSLPLTAPSTGLAPESKTGVARVTLLWKPTTDFTASFKFTQSRETGNGENSQSEFYCVNGNPHLTVSNLITGASYVDLQSNCKDDGVGAQSALPAQIAATIPGWRADGRTSSSTNASLGVLNLNYDVANIALAAITGYTYLNTFGDGLYDGTVFSSIASVSSLKIPSVSIAMTRCWPRNSDPI
jgi:iron complex outermembrane receptor protein